MSFESASLELLGSRALQKRVDTKFILQFDTLQDVLATLTPEYALVRAGGEPIGQYRTLYLDTEDYELVREHHRGRRPRYKVRIRHYVERRLTFLEIKQKTNANTTLKARRPIPYETEVLTDEDRAFIATHTPLDPARLVPSLRTDFSRLTLVGKHTLERATFDINLLFRAPNHQDGFPTLVIAEVKQDRFRSQTPLMLALKSAGLRPQSVSKYCTAAVLLQPDLVINRFYPVLRAIRKTCNATPA